MPSPKLEELAAEGQKRRAEHEAEVAQSGIVDRELMIALGAHYGTKGQHLVGKLLKVALATFAVALVLAVAGEKEVSRVLGLVGFIATMLLLSLRFGLTPTASPAQREAEEVWLRNLPFTLTGYFEALRLEPRKECRLRFTLERASEPTPTAELIGGLVHRSDPGAAPESDGSGWLSSAISGATNMRHNKQPIYRNHRLVKHVHDLVEQVLLPLHREYPLERVTLRRET